MNDDRIQIYKDDPRYWQYKGKPVLLIGGTACDNLFRIPNLKDHLDLLQSVGGNYARCTMSAHASGLYSFRKIGDLYDLEQWNEDYWRRFDEALSLAREREIIVQIEIWATFDFYRDYWNINPYNPKNNCTYTFEETGLPEVVDSHPARAESNFFWSVPAENNQQTVLKYQQRYVDKLLSYSLQYGNILYCMDNETAVTPAWGEYWATYIKAKAAEIGVEIHTTEMFDKIRLEPVLDRPEVYSFVDGSKVMAPRCRNWTLKGEDQWHKILAIHESIANNPRPITSVKIICDKDDKVAEYSVKKFWRNLLGGYASMRFHRSPAGAALSIEAQACIRSMRKLESVIKLWDVEPRLDLLSSRGNNEAYLRAKPGEKYALYFTDGGSVGLNLSGHSGAYTLRWIDISSGEWGDETTIQGGSTVTISAPGAGGWAAAIVRAASTISIRGENFYLDGNPFDMWGIRTASATMNQNLTDHLIDQLDDYKAHGINTVAVFYMGSSGGSFDPFSPDGRSIDPEHQDRMEQIIKACDNREMVVIAGGFYQRVKAEDVSLQDWDACKEAVRTVTKILKPYRNVIINVANEQNSKLHADKPWQRVHNASDIIDLCRIIHQEDASRLAGGGGYDHAKNVIIGSSQDVDILLFDTAGEEDSGALYEQFVSGGVTNKPIANVEFAGAWTLNPVKGVFADSKKRAYLKAVDAAVEKPGLSMFFFANTWSQVDPIRYDLAGNGTSESPGIRWYFDYTAEKLGLNRVK